MRRIALCANLLVFVFLNGCANSKPEAMNDLPESVVATFSIVAFDPDTREWGVAVQSRFLGVGSVVPWAMADVGAVATQSFANTTYGPRGLELLQKGLSAKEALDKLTESDEGRDHRQAAIVDAKGNVAAYTGKKCNEWAGHREGKNYSVQGNILAGEGVVTAMAEGFEKAKGDLGDRLVAALEAGQSAGGDKRGMQSAAILIVKKNGGYGGYNDRYRDLRVEDHARPIEELKRLYELHRKVFPLAK